MQATSPQKTVAVIGAGLAGLATIKSCLEEGLNVQAFEQSDAIGGNWQFRENGISVFRNTELTSSKYLTAFSDFPIPEDYPHFVKHSQYLDYLLAYAQHFDLKRHIQFNTAVESIERTGNRWLLQLNQSGHIVRQTVDAVAVCTGLNEERNLPTIPGAECFQGDFVHSSSYKDNSPYRDKHVVVVGGGESGGDILHEVSQVATTATLSLRRGVFVMPKLDDTMTLPGDYFHHRATYHLPPVFYYRIETAIQQMFTAINRNKAAWQMRQHLIELSGGSYHQQFITKSDVFTSTLTKPNVTLKPGIRECTPTGVIFTDGSEAKADAVIFSSGFKVYFPFLPIESRGWDWGKLYKKVFHPDLPNMGFVGFARPNIGAMPPVTELQARYFAGVASGRLRLPEGDRLQTAIARDAARTAQLKPLVCDRVSSIVSFVPYMYELADLIGCRPVLRHLLLKPRVLWSVLFGTVAAPHFRLSGPYADPAAPDIIAREGLHLHKLKTPAETSLFVLFQLVWGVGGLIGYPLLKGLSHLPGCAALEPELDF
ncbi:MAG: NAD(P)-binding domain-containing protein [Synechococcus sp.]